jgi:hypothetical protein
LFYRRRPKKAALLGQSLDSTGTRASQEVQNARRRFEVIDRLASIPKTGRSELEIVRLLDNVHYKHIEQLLELINASLPQCGSIGTRLLHQTDRFQFDSCLAELFLFLYLRQHLGDSVRAATLGPSQKGPDIVVSWEDLSVKLEIYSPIDLMGFQMIEKLLGSLFKYIEVDRGFQLHIDITSICDFPKSSFYPLSIPSERQLILWLKDVAEKAYVWLSQSHLRDGHHLRVEGPGCDMVIDARLQKLEDDPAIREIAYNFGSYSTDCRLLFECETPDAIARSRWGQKIKQKLEKKQAGLSGAHDLNILVIDFDRAHTSSPNFICWPKIADKLSETVAAIVKNISGPTSYDMLLPARLNLECCFSAPIWIDRSKTQRGQIFIQKARLNRPCTEGVQDQTELIDRMTRRAIQSVVGD